MVWVSLIERICPLSQPFFRESTVLQQCFFDTSKKMMPPWQHQRLPQFLASLEQA
jgi:hypothetical protein